MIQIVNMSSACATPEFAGQSLVSYSHHAARCLAWPSHCSLEYHVMYPITGILLDLRVYLPFSMSVTLCEYTESPIYPTSLPTLVALLAVLCARPLLFVRTDHPARNGGSTMVATGYDYLWRH